MFFNVTSLLVAKGMKGCIKKAKKVYVVKAREGP
jgi:hypothetical protein